MVVLQRAFFELNLANLIKLHRTTTSLYDRETDEPGRRVRQDFVAAADERARTTNSEESG